MSIKLVDEKYCISTEINDNECFFIMVYSDLSKRFYQKTYDSTEWKSVTKDFTPKENLAVIDECINKTPGYVMVVDESDNGLTLYFSCREVIREYKYCLQLNNKSDDDITNFKKYFDAVTDNIIDMYMTSIHKFLKNLTANCQTEPDQIQTSLQQVDNDKDRIKEALTEISADVHDFLTSKNKESVFLPFIAKHFSNDNANEQNKSVKVDESVTVNKPVVSAKKSAKNYVSKKPNKAASYESSESEDESLSDSSEYLSDDYDSSDSEEVVVKKSLPAVSASQICGKKLYESTTTGKYGKYAKFESDSDDETKKHKSKKHKSSKKSSKTSKSSKKSGNKC